MANTTGNDRIQSVPWTTDFMLKLNNAVPGSTTTFYAGQAVGRDASGNLVQMDDTAKAEFVGILQDLVRTDVFASDAVGDKPFLVDRPLSFTAVIASAAAGDELKKVYWKYNNEVQYGCGTNGNFAGTVIRVIDSTHVQVLAPWASAYLGGDRRANIALADAAATLTKWDVNKTFQVPTTTGRTITLPAVASTSPGDRITFINTGSATAQLTIKGNGSENINGANTLNVGTAQYSVKTVESDGTQWFSV